MRTRLIIVLLLGTFLITFRMAEEYRLLYPSYFPKPQYNFSNNILSNEKILLGRMLFYDPILSRDNSISCASCHSQFSSFSHTDHALSHGIEDRIGMRNTPVLVNIAWQKHFMLDGAVNHLDAQALAPINSPTEMDASTASVIAKLRAEEKYRVLFYNAFGDSLVSTENMLKAMSQFMLSMVSQDSKYDSVRKGLSSYNEQEARGYKLFQKNCNTCHTEPLFTNHTFKNNGLPLDPLLQDYGRYRVTQNPSDSLQFKVPTLRNIEFSYPYMHDGRFKTLAEVMNHYSKGISTSSGISPELKQALKLSSKDKVDITAFLLSLSDRKFLFDPAYGYPRETISKYNTKKNP